MKATANNNNTEEKKIHPAWTTDFQAVNSLKIVNAVFQNANLSAENVRTILPYVKNEKFAEILNGQVKKYEDFCSRAEKLAKKYGGELQSDNAFGRFFIRTGIKMKLLSDTSVSRIAEMMLQGSTMGIIDLGKLIRHTPDVSEEAQTLLRELLIYEEDKVELMKYYL